MGRIYVMGLICTTFPMSHSWEGFTSLLNGVNSLKVNLFKFIIHGNDLRTFHKPHLTDINFNKKCVNPPHVDTHLINY